MNSGKMLSDLIGDTVREMNDTIDCLYITSNPCAKNKLLNSLRKDLSIIDAFMKGMQNGYNSNGQGSGEVTFTAAELAAMNGKNGNPAYIAVNGTVYDVTDTAAWGGATHFGLTAGKDLTAQYSTCHAAQPVLNKLKIVGKMAQ